MDRPHYRRAGLPPVALVVALGLLLLVPGPALSVVLPNAPVGNDHPSLAAAGTSPHPSDLSNGNATVATDAWPGFAGAGNLSGQSASALPQTNATLWSVYSGVRGTPPFGAVDWGAPAVYGGLVYVGTGEAGGVVAFNATNGELVWASTLPSHLPIYGGLLVADHKVLVPVWQDPINGSGILDLLNASNGALLWSASMGISGPLLAPPNLVDGTILEADAGSGNAYGWRENGHLNYTVPLSGSSREPVTSPISVLSAAQPLALAVSGPSIYAYDALTGAPFPGVSWSPYSLPEAINGSVAQTMYSWTDKGGTSYQIPLALAGDNGGATFPSDVQVLCDLQCPLQLPVPSLPLVASWTTPSSGEGFYGAPAVLGQRGSNLTFALVQANGTIGVFSFSANATGVATVGPLEFLAWGQGATLPAPTTSLVVSGGPQGDLLMDTPTGHLLAFSVAGRDRLWELNSSAGFYGAPAVADSRVFARDLNGTLWAVGGATPPPVATRLLLSTNAPLWVAGSSRLNISVTGTVWYPNGSRTGADGAHVTFAPRLGNATHPTANASAGGIANFTYQAPTVSVETNVTVFVNATWRTDDNGTSFVIVVVPPGLVDDTPLLIVPSPPPPASIGSGQAVDISFAVQVGSTGPPLTDALATFTALGGTSSVVRSYTNHTGSVNSTFTAGQVATITPVGLTLTIEKAGYEPGTYSWVTFVNPLPQLVLRLTPPSLLLVANSTETFQVEVNSTLGLVVPNAVVTLTAPSIGGNLSIAGGTTDALGELRSTYASPLHVPQPGESASIQVVVSASGFATASVELALSLIPNGTAAATTSPTSTNGNPLAGLSAGEGWGLIALLALLAFAVVVLLLRRPPAPPIRPRVWEEWEERKGSGSEEPRKEEPPAEAGPASPPGTSSEADGGAPGVDGPSETSP